MVISGRRATHRRRAALATAIPWVTHRSTMAQDVLGLLAPQVGAVAVTLALITLAAERLQVVHGIVPAMGARQDMVHLQQNPIPAR